MARLFSPRDAKRLIREQEQIRKDLENVGRSEERYRNQISEAVKVLVGKEVMVLLKDIDIEEINRDRRGIKVKLLRESGYQTIADIAGASVHNIEAIHGIGEDSAYTIHRMVREIIDQTGRTVKVKLNLDDQSAANTNLVTAIAKYQKSLPCIERSHQLLSDYGQDISYALEDLRPGTGFWGWIFTSGANKERAEYAFSYLNDTVYNDYTLQAKEIQEELYYVDRMQGKEAWEEFRKDPIRFYNILEDVEPGILGTDDTVYGLPEELARQIQEECVFPDGLKCQLRRYQEWGVKYILHQEKVLLGDEMGLGKTIQAIAAMVSLKNTGATHFMVVCPASVISNWCREVRKHSLLSVTRIHGSNRMAALQSWMETGGVAVTTYETTGFIDLEEISSGMAGDARRKAFRFSMMIVDEAHYIKNPDAKRTKNVARISTYADRLLFMTGTALENRVDEMINLIGLLQPQIADSVQNMTYLSSAPQFREKIAPVYYRRRREDVLTELPELIESKEWCILQPEEERLYEEAILGRRFADARRVSWNVEDLKQSSKAERMMELIEEAEEDGRKIIVFSFFLDTIRKVCDLLGEKALPPINGSVPPARRQDIIDEFEKASAGTVLAAQIQSGGTGLNIQSASVVILCEPQFKPSIENQAISRAYRMGQTRNVLVYRLLCDDTVDEKIVDLLEEKQKIFDAFADESAAGTESLELDQKTFGNIVQEEIERINLSRSSCSRKAFLSSPPAYPVRLPFDPTTR